MKTSLTQLSVMISRVMASHDRKFKGFTFVELILVILIIAVLVTATTPNLKRTYSNIHLSNFARDFQAMMNYLHERAIVDGTIIYLNFQDKEYWAEVKDVGTRLQDYTLGPEIKIEPEIKKIAFYPDGSIDKVDIKLSDTYDNSIILTTKGVFNGVKLQPKAN